MLRTRIIPTLLLKDESLVKTVRFGKYRYIGDPCNTVRIFNELEVDELLFLDIDATKSGRLPNYRVLRDIASECFMPLAYGGGIRTLESAKMVFDSGFEKIAINSSTIENHQLIYQLAAQYGSQAVIASIDVKRNLFGRYEVRTHGGLKKTGLDPFKWAKQLEEFGAGEILLTAIDREGTWSGFDLKLLKGITSLVRIPVIAHGGAGDLKHIGQAVKEAGASAVALGSLVVFQKRDLGVLINFPDKAKIEAELR